MGTLSGSGMIKYALIICDYFFYLLLILGSMILINSSEIHQNFKDKSIKVADDLDGLTVLKG